MIKKYGALGFVPSGSGYVPLEDLAQSDRVVFEKTIVERIGKVLAPYVKAGKEDGADWSPEKI